MTLNEPEHIRMIRETVRRFVDQEMTRRKAYEWDRDNHFPRDVFGKLAETGMMAVTIPEEFGGSGRDILATMAVIEELGRRSLAVAVPYIMSTCYAGMNLVECGSEEQKLEYSGAGIADYIYALVRTGPADERYRNLSIVLIPPNTPGVDIDFLDCMGMKGAATTDVSFSDVEIPIANVIGGADGWNRGWEFIVGSGLDVEKLEVAALSLGIAVGAVEDAWAYVQERQQFGRRILEHQSIRHMLADMQTSLHACRLVMAQAASLAQAGERCSIETSMAKLFICEAAKKIVLDCQTIHGAYGYEKEFGIERYVRDVLLMPIIGGSSAIQRNNIVNWMGLPKA